ncbi:MAG TPA: GAF and ANTAR domain-containing protein [Actinopolymorphaceae bacterium]|jgi:GAF domain-containing protein
MPHIHDFGLRLAMVHETRDEDQTIQAVIDSALGMFDCQRASVMMRHGVSRIETAAHTDDTALRADQLQIVYGQGPCLTALEAGAAHRIDDAAIDPRWSTWGVMVAGIGIRSVLTVPLAGGDRQVLGSLNLYAHRTCAFDVEDEAIAHILATHASIALEKVRLQSSIRRAMDGRTVLGQAQGIVMERYGVTDEQAFSLLNRYSQQRDVKLRLIADEVAQSRMLPSLDQR